MATLRDKFRGCLLGAMVGDVVGAAVEAESAEYIAKTYRSVEEILATESVEEFKGPAWQVGRFTDDTQMMICVAEWLLECETHAPEILLARFAEAYEPWRRYGSGTEAILRGFPKFEEEWREFATAMFPFGSYGNGSAMRVAPIGLVYHKDLEKAVRVAVASSRPTHSHPLAYQGVELQVIAVAAAVSCDDFSPNAFIPHMRGVLTRYSELLQDTSKFESALNNIEEGLRDGRSCKEMSAVLGTGVTAQEAVPMAIYCFLRHPESYCDVIREAVFIGGDTDTIACMAGAISGAFLGASAIPSKWLGAVREETYSVSALEVLADRLFAKFTADS